MLTRALAALCVAVACTACDAGDGASRPTRARQPPQSVRERPSSAPPISVIEFFDYGCNYCADFDRTVLPVLRREFVTTGRARWQLVPFASSVTPYAADAAAAVLCAAEQDREWAMHTRLFARRPDWILSRDRALRLRAFARALSLDDARFAACFGDPGTHARVEAQRHAARQLGVRVAPTFLVNGRRIEGTVSLEAFRAALEAATP